MKVQKTNAHVVHPPTFASIRKFHEQLQKLAKTPDYSFICQPNKKFDARTKWLEKKTVLSHTGWCVTSGYIHVHLYVALSRKFKGKRIAHSEENMRRFADLLEHSKQIEAAFGQELIWQEDTTSAGMYQASIFVLPTALKIADDYNEDRWPEIQRELLATAKRLNDALSPHFSRIKKAERLKSNPKRAPTEASLPSPALTSEKPPRAQTLPDILQTAETADTLTGDKLYQQRARQALPILVRQAYAGKTIYYSDLAREMGMPNERNLNYVLGSIGQTLLQLSKDLAENIPPIQCLVVNRQTGLPGEGIGWFIDKVRYSEMSKQEQAAILRAQLEMVFQYPKWEKVLNHLGFHPLGNSMLPDQLSKASKRFKFDAVESEHHKKLKEFIAANPSVLGLPVTTPFGIIEFDLPSGDTVDVLFQTDKQWTAVEVKSHISQEPDLIRGLFQCVKYHAVAKAQLASLGKKANVRTVLVIGKPLPDSLIPLKHVLGVKVHVQTTTS